MSMRYRKLDENGDYSFGRGHSDFVEDTYAVAQAIKTRLKTFQGEWWEDIHFGLPYFQKLLGYEGKNKEKSAAIIQAYIAQTTGVNKVLSSSSSYDGTTRAFLYSAVVEDIYGNPIAVTNE